MNMVPQIVNKRCNTAEQFVAAVEEDIRKNESFEGRVNCCRSWTELAMAVYQRVSAMMMDEYAERDRNRTELLYEYIEEQRRRTDSPRKMAYTTTEACKLLGMSKNTMNKKLQTREILGQKDESGRWSIPRQEIAKRIRTDEF